MKKVAFFIESLSGGGAEKVLTTIVKKLDKQKFDVTIFTIIKTGIYVEEVEKYCHLKYILSEYDDISSRIGKVKYRIRYKEIYKKDCMKIYKKYVKEEYDVEVAFVEGFVTKLVASSPNKKSKKICWVHTDMEHNSYADQYYSSIQEERDIYQKYDRVIGISESVKDIFEKKFNLKDKVKVIYNPVDDEDIIARAKQGRRSLMKEEQEIKIISVGRLEKPKGYDRLIKGLGKSDYKNYPFHLWILGEGSEREHLEQLIKSNCLEEKVSLLGFQKNPYAWLEAADVFVCSSRAEGYSLAIAEAMILGLPILSVDCAGPNELLDFGKYGILIPNTDEALERELKNLIEGEIDLEKYAQLSKQRRQFFRLLSVLEQIEKLLMDE